jgi:hypothetical protein
VYALLACSQCCEDLHLERPRIVNAIPRPDAEIPLSVACFRESRGRKRFEEIGRGDSWSLVVSLCGEYFLFRLLKLLLEAHAFSSTRMKSSDLTTGLNLSRFNFRAAFDSWWETPLLKSNRITRHWVFMTADRRPCNPCWWRMLSLFPSSRPSFNLPNASILPMRDSASF